MADFIKNGTEVEILNSGVRGIVVGVCIRGIEPNLTFEYNVVYIISGQAHNEWLYSYLVKPHIDTTRKAGMVNYEKLPSTID